MILAHKITLGPNDVQETSCQKAAGKARFACNWALDHRQRQDAMIPRCPSLLNRRCVNRPIPS